MVTPTSDGTLVLMGSGETTPTMVTVHKTLLDATRRRTGHDPVVAALLNTPYGFQENAAEITAKAQHYFDHNVGQPVTAIDAGVVEGAPPADVERMLDAVRQADWLFAGPGSPTYALTQWSQAAFADAMVEVCRRGGTVIFASAAAVTAGSHAVPVYEIYKAGHPAGWEEGLGLMQQVTGWPCVVIPHFDNAEGQTHDTRFCYLGERRLAMMERELPDDAWILGVDEHTACIIDGTGGTVTVQGRGGVHVRHQGRIVLDLASGQQSSMADLVAVTKGPQAPAVTPTTPPPAAQGTPASDRGPANPFEEQLRVLRATFDDALDASDAEAATAAALDTQQLMVEWAGDSLSSDAMDRATAQLRAMTTRLGVLAEAGLHDHSELVRPHIETLLHVREDARERSAFEVADHIRGHMDADGVTVKDTREGSVWEWDEPDR